MSDFLKRQFARDKQVQLASKWTYQQFMADMFAITLNDPEVMGKDAFSWKRIRKVMDGVEANYDLFYDALDGKAYDADYLRQKFDQRLLQIYPEDEFVPFDERYPHCQKLVPIGKEKKK